METAKDQVNQFPISVVLLASLLLCLSLSLLRSSSSGGDPFRDIPGPVLGRFSSIRHFYHAWRGDLHLDVDRCHHQYGPVVRYAPSKIVFNTASAAEQLYGPNRYVTKSWGYNTQPFKRDHASLFNCLQPEYAAAKKKLLRPAMSPQGMLLHSRSVQDNTQTLVDMLHAQKDSVQDMSSVAFHYALDVVSQSTLSTPFGLLSKEDDHWLTGHIVNANTHMYLQLAWPRMFAWVQSLLDRNCLTYSRFYDESKQFLNISYRALANSREQPANSMHALMKAGADQSVSPQELTMEALSFLRGGGDTVAVTIAATLFYALKDKAIYTKLQEEVRKTFNRSEDIKPGPQLDSCTYLTACVNEALRIAPPGPGVFWRQADREMIIDGIVIPAGTEVGVSIFGMQHNERLFEDPATFRPERFLDDYEGGGSKSSSKTNGFMPFLRGFRACPAQKLAFPMMLVPIARLFWEFDLEDVEDQGALEKGQEKRTYYDQVDVFGSTVRGPWVKFHPHGDAKSGSIDAEE